MVCSRCTLLHVQYAAVCTSCGHPLQPSLQRLSTLAMDRAPLGIGVVSGAALLCCLSVALIAPSLAVPVLGIGAYVGLISIANVWLSVYRGDRDDLLRGARGFAYGAALLISLVAELARLQHLETLPGGLPVPSALATELLAAVLIVLDPLVLTPLQRWIADGVQREEP